MVDIVSHVYDQYNENHFDYEEIFKLSSKMKEGIRIFDTSNDVKEYSSDDAFAAK